MEDGHRVFTFPMPQTSGLTVRIDVGGFSAQSVEQNISTEENKVRWTEGLPITTGESPSIISGGEGGGVPVFSHELAIVEGTGSSAKVFKVGVVPRFNEVSSIFLRDATTVLSRVNSPELKLSTTSSLGAQQWLSTTSNTLTSNRSNAFAAPHYGKVFQNFVAAGNVPGMKLDLACATTTERLDCTDSAVVNFSAVDTSVYATSMDPTSDAQSFDGSMLLPSSESGRRMA